jgi:hypothetical protein
MVNGLLIDKPEVGLADQSRGLERMVRPFSSHETRGDLAKLGLQQGEYLVYQVFFAAGGTREQMRKVRLLSHLTALP